MSRLSPARDFTFCDVFACMPDRANHSSYTRIERKTPFRVYQQKILPHPIHADCDCISISRVIKNILRNEIHAIFTLYDVFACIPSVANLSTYTQIET